VEGGGRTVMEGRGGKKKKRKLAVVCGWGVFGAGITEAAVERERNSAREGKTCKKERGGVTKRNPRKTTRRTQADATESQHNTPTKKPEERKKKTSKGE